MPVHQKKTNATFSNITCGRTSSLQLSINSVNELHFIYLYTFYRFMRQTSKHKAILLPDTKQGSHTIKVIKSPNTKKYRDSNKLQKIKDIVNNKPDTLSLNKIGGTTNDTFSTQA